MTYFQETSVNYISTPIGVLHTNKPLNEINIFDLTNTKSNKENYEHHYKVTCSDTAIYIEGKYVGDFFNNTYFEPVIK